MSREELERATPEPVNSGGFNPDVELPYGLTTEHVRRAMEDFVNFLGFINEQLHSRGLERQESMMDSAGFSGMVGGFMDSGISKYCPTPRTTTTMDTRTYSLRAATPMMPHSTSEKGSRLKGRVGEADGRATTPRISGSWSFSTTSNKPADLAQTIDLRPFRFVQVLGARLTKKDWNFSGRRGESRRTITASVNKHGARKMRENWIYEAPE